MTIPVSCFDFWYVQTAYFEGHRKQIRAKERAQAEETMRGQTPEQQLRSLQLSRLPKLVDTMHMYGAPHSLGVGGCA